MRWLACWCLLVLIEPSISSRAESTTVSQFTKHRFSPKSYYVDGERGISLCDLTELITTMEDNHDLSIFPWLTVWSQVARMALVPGLALIYPKPLLIQLYPLITSYSKLRMCVHHHAMVDKLLGCSKLFCFWSRNSPTTLQEGSTSATQLAIKLGRSRLQMQDTGTAPSQSL